LGQGNAKSKKAAKNLEKGWGTAGGGVKVKERGSMPGIHVQLRE